MNIQQKIEEKKEDYRRLQRAREERAYRKQHKIKFKEIKEPNQIKSYNYKIKYTGNQAQSIQYEEPILMGYERKHNPVRKEGRTMANEQNVKRARRNVYDIVNCNYTEYTKMLTLTYAKTVLDYDQLAKDWKAFLLNLKRKNITFPFLAITEHQTKRGKKEGNDGSLHLHVLLFTDEFIPFETLKSAWGDRGSVHVEKIDKASNKGAYVAKYITKETMPPDKKAYRTSRNIKRPVYKTGLGSELDIILAVREFEFVDTYNYTVERGVNQETGEIKEEITARVSNYSKR